MILTDDFTTSVILEHEPGTFYVVRGGRVQTVLRVEINRRQPNPLHDHNFEALYESTLKSRPDQRPLARFQVTSTS